MERRQPVAERGTSGEKQFNSNRRDQIKFEQETLKFLLTYKRNSVEYNNFMEERLKQALDGAERRHFWLVGHGEIVSKFKNLKSQADYDSNRMQILKTKREQRTKCTSNS